MNESRQIWRAYTVTESSQHLKAVEALNESITKSVAETITERWELGGLYHNHDWKCQNFWSEINVTPTSNGSDYSLANGGLVRIDWPGARHNSMIKIAVKCEPEQALAIGSDGYELDEWITYLDIINAAPQLQRIGNEMVSPNWGYSVEPPYSNTLETMLGLLPNDLEYGPWRTTFSAIISHIDAESDC